MFWIVVRGLITGDNSQWLLESEEYTPPVGEYDPQ